MSYQRFNLTAPQRRLLLDLVAAGDRLTFAEADEQLRADIDTLAEYRYLDIHRTGDHLIVDTRDEAWRWMRGELDAGRVPGIEADDTERNAWRHFSWRIATAGVTAETDPEWGHVSISAEVDMHTIDEPAEVDPAKAKVEACRGSWDHNDGVELHVSVRRTDPADSIFTYCELTPAAARHLAAALVAGADLIEAHPRPVSQHVEYAWNDLYHTPGQELSRATVLDHNRLTGIDRAEAEIALDMLLKNGDLPLPAGRQAHDYQS